MNGIYVHGYLGTAEGRASQLLRAEMAQRGWDGWIEAPAFPVTEPERMKEKLTELLQSGRYDYVVSTSLGAFHMMLFPDIPRILVNPAMPENLEVIRKRESHEDLTDEFLDKMKRDRQQIIETCGGDPTMKNTYLVFGLHDTIAPNEKAWRQVFTKEDHIFRVDMEHRIDETGAKVVLDILESIKKGK